MDPQRDNRVKVSALLRVGHKENEGANLFAATKKRVDNGESGNRRAGSGRKTVVDRDSLRDAI